MDGKLATNALGQKSNAPQSVSRFAVAAWQWRMRSSLKENRRAALDIVAQTLTSVEQKLIQEEKRFLSALSQAACGSSLRKLQKSWRSWKISGRRCREL